MIFFLVFEIIYYKKIEDLVECICKERIWVILGMINLVWLMVLFKNLSLIMVVVVSLVMVWNMYSLLILICYVLNLWFDLDILMLGGFFYFVLGVGYILGMFGGG